MNAATQNRLFAEDGVTTEPVISVRGLRTAFGDHVVHDNLDLTVFRGEIMVLVGGSGTGKTVLLRQIIGLERPAAGSVRVLGQSLFDLAPAERRRLSYRWGMLFQAGALFSALSVYDNVALPLRELRAIPEDLVHDVVMCRLAMVGLSAQDAGKRPSDLSGGMVNGWRWRVRCRWIPSWCSWTSPPRGWIRCARTSSSTWCAACTGSWASPSSW